jgi:iron complex outermembrane recepter protein
MPDDFDGTTYPMTYVVDQGSIQSFSQELRVDGTWDRLRWMAGANYQNDTVDELYMSHDIGSGAHLGPFDYDGFDVENDQKIKTYGGFGSVDFALTDQLTLQGSARYTKQDRDYAGCGRDPGDGEIAQAFSLAFTGSPTTIPPGACVTLSDTFQPLPIVTGQLNQNNVSWRGGINYKPDDNTLIYANITKGFKAGGFPTLPAAFASQLQSIPQESLLAYEVGSKIPEFNHALEVDGAVFYYDYTDKQLVGFRTIVPFGPLPSLVSIPRSHVDGAELNLVLRPIKGLALSAGGALTETRVDSNPIDPTGAFGNSAGVSFVGQSFPFTPRWTSVVDGEYRFGN